ncbi:hypothetical protein Gasu2_32130 [Galdieria sulphuraria]|uniref:Translocon-associated protein alpha subunit n=1 Tax=Galdieria sulphuraria TaxID=130081 RepID=M2XH55_GALSU|nr:translocon-associated protein alpha subunit [Galdieria sulphuraria]EME29397.1 translocon-associated protein alpha subunit [Galdieria sulphuraria]GJD08936.1 hypothetical protein Gasu2_32130 [Galdieria sulphuraria]|eukprot:XP_005705917.1 translocon-associated protein alpha subunit [Galdieria sulphuraria]
MVIYATGTKLFLLVVVICCWVSFVFSEQQETLSLPTYTLISAAEVFRDDAPHPLSRNLPSSSEIEIAYSFSIENEEKSIQPGTLVDCLVGVANGGPFPYRILAIGGALHSPAQFNYYVQNFTLLYVNYTISPGKELTFSYRFQPHMQLEPANYIMSLDLFYDGEPLEEMTKDQERTLSSVMFRTTFYNASLAMKDESNPVDNRLFYITVVAIVTLLLFAFSFYKFFYPTLKPRAKKLISSKKSSNQNDMNDWLQGHHEVLKASNIVNQKRSVSPNSRNMKNE